MTRRFIYPDVIAEIRAVCSAHFSGQASNADVQRVIGQAEQAIVAIEKNDTQEIAREELSWLVACEKDTA